MVLAAYLGTGYKIMLFIHILAMIVAFAPSFVWPFVAVRLRKEGDQDVAGTINKLTGGNTMKVYGPALAVGGLVGFGLAGMSKVTPDSDPLFSMSQTWLVLAALIWFVLLGLYFAVMAPAEKKMAEGDRSGEKLLNMVGGIIHLLAAVALLLMIFKPGGPNI
jgi:uncharacterized membrane protein